MGSSPQVAEVKLPPRPIILITRPQAAAERFANSLGQLDAERIISPVLQAQARQISALEIGPLIFTSGIAIQSAADQFNLAGRQCFVVGTKSAELARSLGMNVIACEADARQLSLAIIARRPKGTLTYLRGSEISFDMVTALHENRVKVQSTVAYDMRPMPLSESARLAFGGEHDLILPLFSARSSATLSEQIDEKTTKARMHLVGISKKVSQSWVGPMPASIWHAKTPDSGAMVTEIKKVLESIS